MFADHRFATKGETCFLLYPFSKSKQPIAPFEELRPQILEQYYGELFEMEQQKWVEQAKRRSAIEIKLATPPQNP